MMVKDQTKPIEQIRQFVSQGNFDCTYGYSLLSKCILSELNDEDLLIVQEFTSHLVSKGQQGLSQFFLPINQEIMLRQTGRLNKSVTELEKMQKDLNASVNKFSDEVNSIATQASNASIRHWVNHIDRRHYCWNNNCK